MSRRRDKKKGGASSSAAALTSVPNNNNSNSNNQNTADCAICGGHGDEEYVLLCDGEGCDHEIHMFCLQPPMLVVPPGNDIHNTTNNSILTIM